MMKQSFVAVAGLLAGTALAGAPGSAVVVNSCKYDVYLNNVPSEGGGYTETDKILSPSDKWSTTWTELSNGNGWSIKLSKSSSLENIMQYEYTYHNDGIIWYDLSDVNGNPWDGNWEITADGAGCAPKQQAYRYSTDDAYGMQACDDSAIITVTLCSGESQNDGPASSVSKSAAASTSSLSTSTPSTSALSTPPVVSASTPVTTEVPTPTSTTAAVSTTHHYGGHPLEAAAVDETSTSVASTPTTFVTATTKLEEIAPGVTIWEVETAVVTEVVVATQTAPSRIKRHEHHAAHHHEA